jgi:hypothetical protein
MKHEEQNPFNPHEASENISRIMGNYKYKPFPSKKKKKILTSFRVNPRTYL